MRGSYVRAAVIVALVGALGTAAVLWWRHQIPASLLGREAPAIALRDVVTGRTVSLPADMQGRPYAIQFFSYG
jgi:hypothetical protein